MSIENKRKNQNKIVMIGLISLAIGVFTVSYFNSVYATGCYDKFIFSFFTLNPVLKCLDNGGVAFLSGLGDIVFTSLHSGQELVYNGSKWINANESAFTDTTVCNNATSSSGHYGICKDNTVKLRDLTAGTNIGLSLNSTDIMIQNTNPESSSCSDVGSSPSATLCDGGNIHIKSLKSGTGISMTNNADQVIIANSGIIFASCSSGVSCSGTNPLAITNSGVISLTAGTGISLNSTTGAVRVTNSGVISGSCSNGISCSGTNPLAINGSSLQNQETTVCDNRGHGAGNVVNASSSGNCHFRGIASGTGISLSQNNTDISITNSGVTSLTCANHLSCSASSGAVTITPSWRNLANTTYTEAFVLNQASGAGSSNLSCITVTFTICAEHITATGALVGKLVNAMTIPLNKVNSPTGTLTAGVFDSSGNVKYTFGTFNIASITGTACSAGNAQVGNFYNYGTGYTIASGDYIGIKGPIQTGTNAMFTCKASSDAYDSTNSKASQFSSGAFADITDDLGASLANSNWNLYYTYQTLTLTATNNLFVQFEPQLNSFGGTTIVFRLNNDTGTTYALRNSANGGADTTAVSQSGCQIGTGATWNTNDRPLVTFWIKNNVAGDRKVLQGVWSAGLDSSSATAPSRGEFTCKWDNTANQITSIQWYINSFPIASQGSSSKIEVWGYN